MPSASFKPLSLASVTLSSSLGTSVTVDTVQVDDLPMVWEITATVGATVYKERHTIGAMNTGPAMTLVQLQAALDGYRQAVADAAAWQASMSAMGPQLK